MKETRSARIELHPAGCIIVRCIPGITQNLDEARENVAVAVELAGGSRRRPLLVDISQVAPLNSEVRHYYVGGALANNFTALALRVEDSPLGHMLGSVFFQMMDAVYRRDQAAGIPTRFFTDEESAIAWLTSEKW